MLIAPGANIAIFQDELKDVHKAIETFIVNVKDVAQIAASGRVPIPSNMRSNFTPSPEAVGLLSLKKRLRREFIRTNDPIIDRLYRRISNRVRKILAILKREASDSFLEKVTADGSKFVLWKLTRRLKRQVAPKFPIRNLDGSWAKAPQDRAEAFAKKLEEPLFLK